MIKFFIYLVTTLIIAINVFPYHKPLSAWHQEFLYKSACDTPKPYKIGSVDPRFNLPKEEFLQITQQAASTWNSTTDKKMLSYDPNATLTVNLIFDQRQSLNNQISELEGQLGSEKSSLSSEIAEYEKLAQSFKDRLSAFDNQVKFWNDQGGAPKDEYEKLKKEQEELKAQAEKLNELARKLNRATESYNVQVGSLNQTIQTFKKELERRPEEGIYNPKEQRIDIYFNINKTELLHTLLHEFGHSLSLAHINSDDSLMFPFTTQTVTASPEDIAAITKVCEDQHVLTIAKNNALFLLQTYIEHRSN
ncbi:MAG: matrixin family metalloprotease [Candidatus Levybacteria bacterium]|nr:matrixin family metalloprotease [Candidatus Levybacteria bacterium]